MSRQDSAGLQKNSNVALEQVHKKQPSLENAQGYYRSQAFLSSTSLNPLVASAYPLLTMGVRLSEIDPYPDITHLYQILVHEMRAFENQSRYREYRQNVIIIARYFLCVFLDEAILQSSWGEGWKQCSLQSTFYHEDTSEEHTFDIINRLLNQPTQYIDLLELGYLCFSLSLKNKQNQSMSTDFLEKIDKIYRAIREERGEISHGFLVEELIHQPVTKNQKSAGWSYSHTLFFFTGMALVAYGFFCYGLNLASTPLMQQLASFSGN